MIFLKAYLNDINIIKMSGTGKIWVSVDPVNGRINIYPKWVAIKIEEKYKLFVNCRNTRDSNTVFNHQTLNLGVDFFNATINLSEAEYYQTTPGFYAGSRFGNKPPGYRNILPITVVDNKFTVYGYLTRQGEWRITLNKNIAIKTFNETIYDPNILLSADEVMDNSSESSEPNIWLPNDLRDESDDNKYVCVWMWCRATRNIENYLPSNLFKLEDVWWTPYSSLQNKVIENEFKTNKKNVEIILFDNTKRTIVFDYESSWYAKQVNNINLPINKQGIRIIKRVIIKVSDLKNKMKNLNITYADVSNISDLDNIPNTFYCCISQQVMCDPVKTHDNHTYDRSSIQKWFNLGHKTSPLTGLPLVSLDLTPNEELKSEILKFIESYNPQTLSESTIQIESSETNKKSN